MSDRKKPRRTGHPYDGAADAAATATKHTRIIPDGAHYSGLGKDYGGMYNPDYKSDIDRVVQALQECEEYFARKADAEYFTDSPMPQPNEEMRLLSVVLEALANLNKTDPET